MGTTSVGNSRQWGRPHRESFLVVHRIGYCLTRCLLLLSFPHFLCLVPVVTVQTGQSLGMTHPSRPRSHCPSLSTSILSPQAEATWESWSASARGRGRFRDLCSLGLSISWYRSLLGHKVYSLNRQILVASFVVAPHLPFGSRPRAQ